MNHTHMIETIKSYNGKITNLRHIIKNFMSNYQSNYPKDWPLFQKTYHELYLGRSSDQQLCLVCGIRPLKFLGLNKGYALNCSGSCRNKNESYIEKSKRTNLDRYGSEFASQSLEFRNQVKVTLMEKYGISNPMKSDIFKNKLKITSLQNYKVDNPAKSEIVKNKIRNSRINNGSWIDDSKRSELEKYRLKVKRLTEESYRENFGRINPNNLSRGRKLYHIDHIFSIEEGFKNNIDPKIISNWVNLRMLSYKENSVKNTKCHMSLDQLLETYKIENPP